MSSAEVLAIVSAVWLKARVPGSADSCSVICWVFVFFAINREEDEWFAIRWELNRLEVRCKAFADSSFSDLLVVLIGNFFDNCDSGLFGRVSDFLFSLSDWFLSLFDWLSDWFLGLFDWLSDWLLSLIDWLSDWLLSLIDWLSNWLLSLFDWLLSLGVSVVSASSVGILESFKESRLSDI